MKPVICAVVLLAACGTAMAVPCAVPWKDGHDVASRRAFNFEIKMKEGKGSCFAHGLAFMASAADDAPVTCDVSFFSGATLKQGWQMTVVAATGSFERVASASAATPPVLRLKAPAGATIRFVPGTIEVSGPGGCSQWLDALTPAEGAQR
jgi:hypothetical protein